MPGEYKYCPISAHPLVEGMAFGSAHKVCSDSECGFVLFVEPKVVVVVVVEYAEKILLGCRAMNPSKGRWNFPGGFVDRFEKVECAALREVKEETNLEVDLKELLGVYSEKGNPIVLLAYRAELKGDFSQMKVQMEEVSELRFFSPDELPEMAFPSEALILRDWRAAKSKL